MSENMKEVYVGSFNPSDIDLDDFCIYGGDVGYFLISQNEEILDSVLSIWRDYFESIKNKLLVIIDDLDIKYENADFTGKILYSIIMANSVSESSISWGKIIMPGDIPLIYITLAKGSQEEIWESHIKPQLQKIINNMEVK